MTSALRHRVNAGLTFEPWIMVWHVTQGVTVVDPGSRPCTPPAESGLWHWLHSVATDGIFRSRGFCVPCGVWQVTQPSALTGACSNVNGPRTSVWHLVQIWFWSSVDFRLFARKVPCTSWQSVHLIKPSFTR